MATRKTLIPIDHVGIIVLKIITIRTMWQAGKPNSHKTIGFKVKEHCYTHYRKVYMHQQKYQPRNNILS